MPHHGLQPSTSAADPSHSMLASATSGWMVVKLHQIVELPHEHDFSILYGLSFHTSSNFDVSARLVMVRLIDFVGLQLAKLVAACGGLWRVCAAPPRQISFTLGELDP